MPAGRCDISVGARARALDGALQGKLPWDHDEVVRKAQKGGNHPGNLGHQGVSAGPGCLAGEVADGQRCRAENKIHHPRRSENPRQVNRIIEGLIHRQNADGESRGTAVGGVIIVSKRQCVCPRGLRDGQVTVVVAREIAVVDIELHAIVAAGPARGVEPA